MGLRCGLQFLVELYGKLLDHRCLGSFSEHILFKKREALYGFSVLAWPFASEVPQSCRPDGEGRHLLPCVDRRGGRATMRREGSGRASKNPKDALGPASALLRSARTGDSSSAKNASLASFLFLPTLNDTVVVFRQSGGLQPLNPKSQNMQPN